jgi:hypothetical protein
MGVDRLRPESTISPPELTIADGACFYHGRPDTMTGLAVDGDGLLWLHGPSVHGLDGAIEGVNGGEAGGLNEVVHFRLSLFFSIRGSSRSLFLVYRAWFPIFYSSRRTSLMQSSFFRVLYLMTQSPSTTAFFTLPQRLETPQPSTSSPRTNFWPLNHNPRSTDLSSL